MVLVEIKTEIAVSLAALLCSTTPTVRSRLTPRQVESYRTQVMEKMQAESVAVLVRQAIRLGRIAP